MTRRQHADAKVIPADAPSWWAVALLTLSVGFAVVAAMLLATGP